MYAYRCRRAEFVILHFGVEVFAHHNELSDNMHFDIVILALIGLNRRYIHIGSIGDCLGLCKGLKGLCTGKTFL